jgi:hypothetical protein
VWLERSFHVATLDYDREEIKSAHGDLRGPGHRHLSDERAIARPRIPVR